MTKIFLGGTVESEKEDGGSILIAPINERIEAAGSSGVYVLIQSWGDTLEHPVMKSIEGKKVKVTIEVME